MNKEQAELYVNSVNEPKIDPQSFFLAMNLVFFAISLAFRHVLVFGIIIGCFAVICIVVLIISKKKSSFFRTNYLLAIQFLMTCFSLNCIVYSIYQFTDKFVLWEYLLSISIQIVVSLFSLVFFKIHSEKTKCNNVKGNVKETVFGSIASLSGALSILLCRIFSPSFSVILSSIAIMLNILSCLFGICVTGVSYRAYLIKKYNIYNKSEIDNQPTQNN